MTALGRLYENVERADLLGLKPEVSAARFARGSARYVECFLAVWNSAGVVGVVDVFVYYICCYGSDAAVEFSFAPECFVFSHGDMSFSESVRACTF